MLRAVVGLTAAVLGVKVLVDGVERVLLLAAMFPGSQDVTHTLVQEGILTLQHTHTHSLTYIMVSSHVVLLLTMLDPMFSAGLVQNLLGFWPGLI